MVVLGLTRQSLITVIKREKPLSDGKKLFYWILEITQVNSYTLYILIRSENQNGKKLPLKNLRTHLFLLLKLKLPQEGNYESKSSGQESDHEMIM